MANKQLQEAVPQTIQALQFPKAQAQTGEEAAKGFERFMYNSSKKLVWLLTINGVLWIWCSYALAFLGKDQIAESLSSNVCTVILGELMTFLLTKTVENVFRYNPKFGGESAFPDDIISRETATAQAQFVIAQAQAQAQSQMYPENEEEPNDLSGVEPELFVDPNQLDV